MVTEWLSPIHVCVIGTLARGPLSVVAGTRTPVSSTLDRASGGSLLCGPHGRTHELNVLVNRAIGFLVTYTIPAFYKVYPWGGGGLWVYVKHK